MIFELRFWMTVWASLSIAPAATAALKAQVLINDEDTSVMQASAPTNLKIEFYDDESNSPLHHFHPMHEKPLHLIVIREDLSTFAHLHPSQLSEHLGLFGIDLNQATEDAYNVDAVKAVPLPGTYFLFAETMPMGYSMTTLPLSLQAQGPSLAPQEISKPDPVAADGKIHKIFGDYQIHLKVKTYPHCGTFSVLLDMKVQKKNPQTFQFEDVTDIEPWLSSFAHTVMVSLDGNTAETKQFIHLHAVWPLADDPETERGPHLRVGSDNHGPLSAGLFKAWVQFKHQGQVHTFPFVLDIPDPTAKGRFAPSCSL
jgi:hypothetical protein